MIPIVDTQSVNLVAEATCCKKPTGIPSCRVINPQEREDKKGDIHFNRELAPDGKHAIRALCKEYRPDTHREFYNEIELAKSRGIKFTLCLIDTWFNEESSIISLVEFCKRHGIHIIDFNTELVAAIGSGTSDNIKKHFPENTPEIIKQTYSIFSTPDTHEMLDKLKPDALIVAGQVAGCCIRASVLGRRKENAVYGEEFGANQYGFPVYTHKSLIWSANEGKDYDELQGDLLFKFEHIGGT